jgi:hypothetical protein
MESHGLWHLLGLACFIEPNVFVTFLRRAGHVSASCSFSG